MSNCKDKNIYRIYHMEKLIFLLIHLIRPNKLIVSFAFFLHSCHKIYFLWRAPLLCPTNDDERDSFKIFLIKIQKKKNILKVYNSFSFFHFFLNRSWRKYVNPLWIQQMRSNPILFRIQTEPPTHFSQVLPLNRKSLKITEMT